MVETKKMIEEGSALRKRFDALKGHMSRAEFAKRYHVPGGDAMIYQHLTARKPISMDCAKAYAKGFGCSLDDISPRLAAEAQQASALLDSGALSAQVIAINENLTRRSYVSDADDLVRDFQSLSDAGQTTARNIIKSLVDLEAAQRAASEIRNGRSDSQ